MKYGSWLFLACAKRLWDVVSLVSVLAWQLHGMIYKVHIRTCSGDVTDAWIVIALTDCLLLFLSYYFLTYTFFLSLEETSSALKKCCDHESWFAIENIILYVDTTNDLSNYCNLPLGISVYIIRSVKYLMGLIWRY